MRLPAITSVSLLASAIAFPAWMAAIVGSSPAPPTMADSTTSASTSLASATSPAPAGHPAQPRLAREDLRSWRTQRPRHGIDGGGIGERQGPRPMVAADLGQALGIRSSGSEALDAEVVGESVHQLERAASDGS